MSVVVKRHQNQNTYICGCLPEENAEELAQVHVIWSLFKAQATAVIQIHGKLCWETLENMHCAALCNNVLKSAIQIQFFIIIIMQFSFMAVCKTGYTPISVFYVFLPYRGPQQGWTFSSLRSSHTSASLWQPDKHTCGYDGCLLVHAFS